MSRNNIIKQINALQKSLDDLEKGKRQRWPTPPPSRLKDTKEDRERPIETPPDVPKKPPYQPMEDVGKAEGDTAPATESTQRDAAKARQRNEAAEDRRIAEIPPQPVVIKKPPYKMEYADKDVELDLKGDSIDKDDYSHGQGRVPEHIKNRDKTKEEIGRGNVRRQGPEKVVVPSKPTPEEDNFEAMRKSLLKLMQYGGA